MQILPTTNHFKTVSELKKAISECHDNFSLPYERSDINKSFFDPVNNTFEVLINKQNEKILIPDSLQYPFLYRGQQKEYNPCLPTLYRNDPTEIQIFIERLRQVEFKFLLDNHPVVKSFFQKNTFKIDYTGLAQHYGLKTNIIDLTNDIEIALFFAMCQYNIERDCYEPATAEGIQEAILYVVVPTFHVNPEGDEFLEDKISVIGLQPFARPGFQKGFSYHIKRNECFNVLKYSFNYSKNDSEHYYEKFDKGEKLWFKDILAEKTKKIAFKSRFSVTTFNRTCDQYLPKGISKNKLKKLLNNSNINISTHNNITKLSDDEIKEIITKWNNHQIDDIIFQVRRKYWNEDGENRKVGKRHDFRTLEMLKQIELLRLIGNTSKIEEYPKQNKTNTNFNEQTCKKKDMGWQKVPRRFELAKSEMFLTKEDCIINSI